MMQNVACLRWSGAHVSIPRCCRGHRHGFFILCFLDKTCLVGSFFSQSFLIYGIWKVCGHCEMGGTLVPMHIRISSIISKLQTCFLRVTPYQLKFYLTYLFWHSSWHLRDIYFGILSDTYSDILSVQHSIWHIFWHSIWHSIWHIFWHLIRHSIWHLFWHSIWHSMWHLALAIEVPQCPLRSGSRSWGPAVPTEIWRSRLRSGSANWQRLRSGSAHWDRAFAV